MLVLCMHCLLHALRCLACRPSACAISLYTYSPAAVCYVTHPASPPPPGAFPTFSPPSPSFKAFLKKGPAGVINERSTRLLNPDTAIDSGICECHIPLLLVANSLLQIPNQAGKPGYMHKNGNILHACASAAPGGGAVLP